MIWICGVEGDLCWEGGFFFRESFAETEFIQRGVHCESVWGRGNMCREVKFVCI